MAPAFSRILCRIGFERDSMDALELACKLAKQNSAIVWLLTVIGAPPAAATELPPVALSVNPEFETECRIRLEALVQEKLAGASHEVFVASGNAAPEILKLAAKRGIDLIVMGTHRRTGVKRLLLGSVAERVVANHRSPS